MNVRELSVKVVGGEKSPSTPFFTLARGFILAAALVGLTPAIAQASPVTITPTMIVLGPGSTTALVTIINEGDGPTRFEAGVSAWSESADGTMVLEPNSDVIVFPQMIMLQPHETKKVRLGTELPIGATERAYRLVLQELPQTSRVSGQVQIQVLSKISVPIFVAPHSAQSKAGIDAAVFKDGVLSFDVVNASAMHFVLQQVEVIGRAASGESFLLNMKGWYVLAGGRRSFHLAIAGENCRRTVSITIKATGDMPPVETMLPISAVACGNGRDTKFLKAGEDFTSAS